jgi:hypothetical protein
MLVRRIAATLLAGAILASFALQHPAKAQGAPPHAWLFGAWAGGILPAPPGMSAAECEARTTFVVTRDVIIHTTIFALAPTDTKPETIGGIPEDLGFGCPQPDVLRVVKVGPNEIKLPDCTGFPSPLVRCPGPTQ